MLLLLFTNGGPGPAPSDNGNLNILLYQTSGLLQNSIGSTTTVTGGATWQS